MTINQLVDIVEDIAGIKLKRKYNLNAPKGVNGRNSDNTLIMELLGWAPNTRCATAWRRPIAGSTMRWSSSRRRADRSPPRLWDDRTSEAPRCESSPSAMGPRLMKTFDR